MGDRRRKQSAANASLTGAGTVIVLPHRLLTPTALSSLSSGHSAFIRARAILRKEKTPAGGNRLSHEPGFFDFAHLSPGSSRRFLRWSIFGFFLIVIGLFAGHGTERVEQWCVRCGCLGEAESHYIWSVRYLHTDWIKPTALTTYVNELKGKCTDHEWTPRHFRRWGTLKTPVQGSGQNPFFIENFHGFAGNNHLNTHPMTLLAKRDPAFFLSLIEEGLQADTASGSRSFDFKSFWPEFKSILVSPEVFMEKKAWFQERMKNPNTPGCNEWLEEKRRRLPENDH